MARTNNLTDFLTDVSTAIKEKTGDNTPIPASQFDTKIAEIETGGTYQAKSLNISQNGNYNLLPDTGYDAMSSVSINANVSGETVNNQDKTITQNGTYTADSGYTGIGTATINVGDGLYWSTAELPNANSVGNKILAAVVTPSSSDGTFSITQSDNIVYSFQKSVVYAQISNTDKQFMIFGRTDSNSDFTDYYAFVYFQNSMKFTMYNENSGSTGLFMNFNSKTETNFYGYVYHYDNTNGWTLDSSLSDEFTTVIQNNSSSTFGILIHFDGTTVWGNNSSFVNRIIPYLFDNSTLSANINYIIGLTQSLYRNQDQSTLMQGANLTNEQIEYHSSYSTLRDVLAAQAYDKLDLYWSNSTIWSKIASSSNVMLPNLFIQDTEPETYDGIWIDSSTFTYNSIVETASESTLVASSINIIKGSNCETILFDSNNGLSYRFNNIILTDANNDTIDNIDIYYGDGSAWQKVMEYTELEYIQSTGIQKIDTGYTPTMNTKFEITLSSVTFKSGGALLSANTTYNNNTYTMFMLESYPDTFAWAYLNSGTIIGTGIQNSHTISIYRNVIYYDNTLVVNDASQYPNTINTTLHLFGVKNDTSHNTEYKLYSFKLYENDVLVRDFIPVKDPNDVVCLYDKITKAYFYNSGSGSFTAGPEI